MIIQEFLTLLSYKVDPRGLKKYEDQTKRTISRTSGFIGRAVAGTLRLGLAFSTLAVGLGAREFLQANQTFELLNAQLETLEGSTEKAAAKFKILQKFAAATPFQLQDVVGLSNRLSAAGFDVDERVLTSIGNLAAQSGRSLNESAEIILSANRGLGARVDNFFGLAAKAENGYLKVSSAALGITKKIKTGDKKALLDFFIAAGEAPGVAGAIEKRAATIEGAISNVKDSLFQFYVQVGQQDGLRAEIQGLARDLSGSVQEGEGLAQILGRAVAKGVVKLRKGLAWLRANGLKTLRDLRQELEKYKPILKTLAAIIVGLKIASLFKGLGGLLTALTAASKGAAGLAGALGITGGAASGLLAYLVLLGVWLADILVFLTTGESALSAWSSQAKNAGGVTGAFAESLDALYGGLGKASDGIKDVVKNGENMRVLNQQLALLEASLRRLGPVGALVADNFGRIIAGIITLGFTEVIRSWGGILETLPKILDEVVIPVFAGWLIIINQILEGIAKFGAMAPGAFRRLSSAATGGSAQFNANPLPFARANAAGGLASRFAQSGRGTVSQTNSSRVTITQNFAGGGQPGDVSSAATGGVAAALKQSFSDVQKNLEGALE